MLLDLDRRLDTIFLSSLARTMRRRHLTYLSPHKLRVLEMTMRQLNEQRIYGDYLEFGVALGGSAILIASNVPQGHAFHGYDVFGMIPPPGPKDDKRSHERYEEIRSGRSQGLGGDTYYGYVENLYDRVCESMAKYRQPVDGRRVHLHQGLFEETLDPSDTRPVAFAHIDCDWYEPVLYCLLSIQNRLVPGARVVLDDYNDYGGCRKAVDAFLERYGARKTMRLCRREPSAILERI
jgi:asparagine synthase (glutamine-hydrolysing)